MEDSVIFSNCYRLTNLCNPTQTHLVVNKTSPGPQNKGTWIWVSGR